ncbi:hypothetical protein [Microlunatus sp. Y2014]|uniref:hypothetical protein n=1 Tax=Microlunatus sp. Y2014 TaxID=3418488 RepID=UPI003DA6E389
MRTLLRVLGWDQVRTKTIFTSTRQAECLSPALLETHPELTGPPAGEDVLTSLPVTISPHEMYRHRLIGAINVAVFGAIDMGKSSFVKNQYVLRPYSAGYRIAVFDRKVQEGKGEYVELAETLGETVLGFSRHGGVRVNPLDPSLAVTSDDEHVGQDELLLTLAEASNGAPLVDTADHAPRYALSRAHKAALATAEADGRVPVLDDVITALYDPSEDAIPGPREAESGDPILSTAGVVTKETLMRWGVSVGLLLERYTSGDWSGIFNGETRGPDGKPLDLRSRLIVFDTSAIPEASQLLGLVMSIMSTFVMSQWAAVKGEKILVLEEAYNAQYMERVTALLRALAKRGRGIGAAVVTILHHLSDLPEGSPMWSLVRECDLVHIYRQDKADDARQAIDMFNLPPWVGESLMTLDRGTQLLLRGKRIAPTYMQHHRTPLEVRLNNTEGALDEAGPFTEGVT